MLKRTLEISAASLLVVLLLLQMQGTWVVFKLQQSAIRHEIKQQIKAGVPEEDLMTLRIAKVWEEESNTRFEREHSREFRFDGEMYDIIRSQDLGDTTLYVCIHDVKESGLFAELDEKVKEETTHPMNEGKRRQIEEWISVKYHVGNLVWFFHQPQVITLETHVEEQYTSLDQQISSPPPRV